MEQLCQGIQMGLHNCGVWSGRIRWGKINGNLGAFLDGGIFRSFALHVDVVRQAFERIQSERIISTDHQS